MFDGPLTGLAASGTGISTGWAPAAGETRTYRLTVEVADNNALQHTRGSGTLTWVRGSGPVTPEPPLDADGRRLDQPAGQRTQAPGFFDAQSSGDSPELNPGRPGGSSSGAMPADSWAAMARKVVGIALDLVGATAKHPGYLVASVGFMWLFLFAADRSEKKRGPYLRFPPDDEDGERALD
ncbi:hypothetical protein M1L60_02740 [Actinoplanes sp. TRM 88003]|uniref:Uncharacterized protein n=1 Tax=Paractinoplanes aksuensis TaxID=2939490 RepID=A0ABT1DFC9_9ACTN|nr:hypothetical protein [Actinoplanes aksuensis]MCO8269505.1 hypothetical protein [Actinoplanes aksuensis]